MNLAQIQIFKQIDDERFRNGFIKGGSFESSETYSKNFDEHLFVLARTWDFDGFSFRLFLDAPTSKKSVLFPLFFNSTRIGRPAKVKRVKRT
jgi:hypothetical protein